MSDIALQIERTASGTIAAGENVIFNTIVYSAGNISYNNITGAIIFNEPGRYSINWWVATQFSASTNGIVFALFSTGDFLQGNSPIKSAEVTGIGIVNVTLAPKTISLINASSALVYYSSIVPVQATLVVIQDDIAAVGPTGPTGSTGTTGPTGEVELAPFGYVYDTAGGEIPSGADIPFSNNGPLMLITHLPGGTDVTVGATGTYLIEYSVSLEGSSGGQLAIAVNGSVESSTVIPAAAAIGNVTGHALLTLNANDIITLRNSVPSPLP